MAKVADEVWNTTSTTARQLRLSEQTIREMFDSGRLQGRRDATGRRLIPQGEVDRVLAELKASKTSQEDQP